MTEPRLLAVANQKGGSAKTTTAVNLAATLAEAGRRVLLVDLDPQCHSSKWLKVLLARENRGLLGVLASADIPLTAILMETAVPNLAIVPGTPWLNAAGMELGPADPTFARLRDKLAALPAGAFDYVLFDCRPVIDYLTLSALVAASEVVIPVETYVLATDGLEELCRTIGEAVELLNPDLTISGIVACRADRTKLTQYIVERLRARWGSLIFATIIRANIRLAEAPSHGVPITLYDPKCSGAEDYRGLAREIIAQETGGKRSSFVQMVQTPSKVAIASID
jgi:chromosome partitioning protein